MRRLRAWLERRRHPLWGADDVAVLVPSGGCYRHAMVEGDDLWLAEQQVAWWLEVGQRLGEYAAHWPECRAVDLQDARCSCGLLDVLGQLDEVVTCTITDSVEMAADRPTSYRTGPR